MLDPLDINTVKHYLLFADGKKQEIAEPTKFDGANFVVKKENGRLGMDVSFMGGDIKLSFNALININGLTHEFKKIITEFLTYGFEGDIKYILSIKENGVINEYVIGQLDFKDPDTDLINYFDCTIIQDLKEAIIKRRESIKIDLFSDKDLDGNTITPLTPENIYLKSVPKNKISSWEMIEPRTYPGASPAIFFNPAPQIVKSNINDTLSPYAGYIQLSDTENPVLEDMAILKAKDKILNATLSLNGSWNFTGSVAFVLRIKKGVDFATSEYLYLEDMELVETAFNLELTIPIIQSGEKIYLYFNAQALSSIDFNFNEFTAELTGDVVPLSSIITGVNFGRAAQQIIKSISGLTTDAPRFLNSGDLSKQYITNGLLIRNITNEPFNLSFGDIVDQLQEFRGDYETTETGVFIGIYEDFYKNEKIGEFLTPPEENFKYGTNEQYAVNKFNFKYSKYEKDNENDGSRESAHTSAQLSLPNKMVENEKGVKVPFIRCNFLIETTRRAAFEVTEETATDQDADIFIIDTIEQTTFINEVLFVNHLVIDPTQIKILNNGDVNFLFFGFQNNDFIELEGENAGFWLITGIEPTILNLTAVGAAIGDFTGQTLTTFIFAVTTTNLVNRTNEGFDLIEGIGNPGGFSNLLFTVKRNIFFYWGRFLSTACYFKNIEFGFIKVTEYIHNGNLRTQRESEPGLIIKENADINLNELAYYTPAKVTPFIVQTIVPCNFYTFWAIRTKARTVRGFIEIEQTNGDNLKIYPRELNFEWGTNLLTIFGEEKAAETTATKPPETLITHYSKIGYVKRGYWK